MKNIKGNLSRYSLLIGPMLIVIIAINFKPLENILNFVFPIVFVISMITIYVSERSAKEIAQKAIRKMSQVEGQTYFEIILNKNKTWRIVVTMINLSTVLIMASVGWYWFAGMGLTTIFMGAYGWHEVKKVITREYLALSLGYLRQAKADHLKQQGR